MWIDDGVISTYSPPEPTACMSEKMLAALTRIARSEGKAGADFIFNGWNEIDAADFASLTPGLDFQPLPERYLDGDFATSAELREYLSAVHLDWRHDAFEVVINLLDSMIEES